MYKQKKIIFVLFIFLYSDVLISDEIDDYYQLKKEISKLRLLWHERQFKLSNLNKPYKHLIFGNDHEKKILKIQNEQRKRFQKIKGLQQRVDKIQERANVETWSGQRALRKVNARLEDTSGIYYCHQDDEEGKYNFFLNDKSFELYNGINGSVDEKILYYASKNKYLTKCLQERKDEKINISYKWKRTCKKGSAADRNNSFKAAYALEKKNHEIILSASLYFKYTGKERGRKEAFETLNKTKSCIVDFYARHGVKINLEFKAETGLIDRFKCDHTISLHDRSTRGNDINWPLYGASNPYLTDSNRCALYLHELGHLFGLDDTYKATKECPDRPLILPKDDIMHSASGGFVERLKIYPVHLKKLLAPLCSP